MNDPMNNMNKTQDQNHPSGSRPADTTAANNISSDPQDHATQAMNPELTIIKIPEAKMRIRPIPTPRNWQRLIQHPLAALAEFGVGIDMNALKSAMFEHGYDPSEPIVLYDNSILDGRHRHQCAAELGIVPTFCELVEGNPVDFVMKKLLRQHLNEDQRARFAAMLANVRPGYNRFAPKVGSAAALSTKGFPTGSSKDKEKPVDSAAALSTQPITQKQAASLMNVRLDAVKEAKKIEEKGTEAVRQAWAEGLISRTDAAYLVDHPKRMQDWAVQDVRNGFTGTARESVVKQQQILCSFCRRMMRTKQPLPMNCQECEQTRRKLQPREPGSDNRGLRRRKMDHKGSGAINWTEWYSCYGKLIRSVDAIYKLGGRVFPNGTIKEDPAHHQLLSTLEEFRKAFKKRYKELTNKEAPGPF